MYFLRDIISPLSIRETITPISIVSAMQTIPVERIQKKEAEDLRLRYFVTKI